MSEKAYALKESVKDFAGGSVAIPPDGKTLDLAVLNDGPYVTSDENEIRALDSVEALKEVPVPGSKPKSKE